MFKKKFPSLSSLGSDGNTAFLRAARAGHLDKVLEHLKANIDINTSNTNGLNALHLASKDGHVPVVTELLKRGAAVDSATKKGNTALHIASLAGQEEVVKLLVATGAAVNVQSQNGFTPLYMAAQENHDDVVKFLLASGANQSLATEDGFTPLAVAMQQGHDKVVAVLLENDTRGKVRLPALHIAAKKDDCKAAALLLQNEHNPDVTSKSGFTPLHIAAHYGNEGIANLLLTRGADVNYSAKHNISPLHVAAKWGKTNLVALLLEKGATIESKTRDGLTPLHCAARSGHEQVVDMMLERQAPISSKTKNGLAPLHMAAQGDHVDAARILLYHRAPVDEVTVDYLTALHVAAHCGHVRVAKLLLDRKADPNARALNGFTPLHIACKKNRIKVVELLLKHGGSIEATTESGLTPLHVASFMGCMNIVIFLLQNDASPDVPTVRGETPLHLAARANQTDIIRILLRNGAQVDARAREQQTPLHIASRLGNVDIVMLLLQHGAVVDSTTKDMYTALHIAAKEGQEEVASVLLENGASLTSTTKKGFTPLHLAAKYGNIKVAKLLLQKEAPVDAQGKNGVTPLHVASHYDHQNVALLLLDKGASPHATAKNGHTPLHIAARKNQMDIATTLLEYNAKANAESKAGFTPLHLSAQEGHTDMSTLLIEHQADTNHNAKNGLTPLHLCAQEDRVNVSTILVKNGAQVDSTTKGGYTPLHVASHFGQLNMVRFLTMNGADVGAATAAGYTPLHQAAQQGHATTVQLLLDKQAPPNAQTSQGQTPLCIAQKLGYISVVESLKGVTDPVVSGGGVADEKYRVVAPETMQETFMSDSEEEGGEDNMLSDQPYRYLTVDEMKSLGDDSLPIDVTRDERMDSNKESAAPPQAMDDTISPQHVKESYAQYAAANYAPDNVDISRHPVNVGFLVSFLVDARGGAMRGCRHSGVRVIVPPRKAAQPMRVTCRYLKRDKLTHPPPLMEGEALASRILELGPVGAKFLGPVIIEVPHFGSLRGAEREIVVLRSDNGETWREHTLEASEEAVHGVLNESFEADEISALEDPGAGRTTRILTADFPQYFAIVSRVRQEVHAIGPEGGMVSSSVVPQVQAVFPPGALTKKIKVGLQAQPISAELAAKLLGNRVAVSPIVTVEPRRRKFHKPITLTIPVPQAANKGMINQYSGEAPTLRLLCSITGGTTRAQWEDVTGSTPLTFVNDCVSFTTTVSARFWLMDCRNIAEATKMATELYREAIHVPFMAKFVVFAKRTDVLEARLRVFCMTDDKEDKTLEHQEHFTEVAKSRDVEVLEGKPQYVEFAGNLVPVTKSGDQLQLGFRAFRENRLPFTVRVKDPHADMLGRVLFMREARVAKGEPPQQPICILNIVLPEDIVAEPTLCEADILALNKKYSFLRDGGLSRLESYQRPDLRLTDISNLVGADWEALASDLGVADADVDAIKSDTSASEAQQAMTMLRLWLAQAGNKANGNTLDTSLRHIGRVDVAEQCAFKVKLDPLRDVAYRRNISLDAAYNDERDIMKESESVEELTRLERSRVQASKRREDSEDGESKYIGEEKVVVEEQRSVSQLKEIFAQDKRDRQYERQPSVGSDRPSRPTSVSERSLMSTIATSDERPTTDADIVERTASTETEPESFTVEEIRQKFSSPQPETITSVTKLTKKLSDADQKTPEPAKKSGIPSLIKTEGKDGVSKTREITSKTETITQKIDGVPTKKITESSETKTEIIKASGIPRKTSESPEVGRKSAIPKVTTKTTVVETSSPKSDVISTTTSEVTVTTKAQGSPAVTKTTKVVETVIRSKGDDTSDKAASERRDSELFQGVSEELGRLETTFKVVAAEEGVLSPKVSKTPPPSPAEFNREANAGQASWGAGSAQSKELQPPTQEWTGKSDSAKESTLSGKPTTKVEATSIETLAAHVGSTEPRSIVQKKLDDANTLPESAHFTSIVSNEETTAIDQPIADLQSSEHNDDDDISVADELSTMSCPQSEKDYAKKVLEEFLLEESKDIPDLEADPEHGVSKALEVVGKVVGNVSVPREIDEPSPKHSIHGALEVAGKVLGTVPMPRELEVEKPQEGHGIPDALGVAGMILGTVSLPRDLPEDESSHVISAALEVAGKVAGTVSVPRDAEESSNRQRRSIPEALEVAGKVAGSVPVPRDIADDEPVRHGITEALEVAGKVAGIVPVPREITEEHLEVEVSQTKRGSITEALEFAGQLAGAIPIRQELPREDVKEMFTGKAEEPIKSHGISGALGLVGDMAGCVPTRRKLSVSEVNLDGTGSHIADKAHGVFEGLGIAGKLAGTIPVHQDISAEDLIPFKVEDAKRDISSLSEQIIGNTRKEADHAMDIITSDTDILISKSEDFDKNVKSAHYEVDNAVEEALHSVGHLAGAIPTRKDIIQSSIDLQEEVKERADLLLEKSVEKTDELADRVQVKSVTTEKQSGILLEESFSKLSEEMKKLEGLAHSGKKSTVSVIEEKISKSKESARNLDEDSDEDISDTKMLKDIFHGTMTKASDFLGNLTKTTEPSEDTSFKDKKEVSFVGLQKSETVIEVNPQSRDTSPNPYVTTPTLPRRGLGVGGSQRLSRDQRPAPLDVTNMPDDSDSEDDDDYIVTEPTDEHENTISEESRVHSSPDILTSPRQIPVTTVEPPRRRPMFHIESEEDDLTDLVVGEMSGREFNLDMGQTIKVTDVDEDDEDEGGQVVKGFMQVGPLGEVMKGVEVVQESSSEREIDGGRLVEKTVVTTRVLTSKDGFVQDDEIEEEFDKAIEDDDESDRLFDELCKEDSDKEGDEAKEESGNEDLKEGSDKIEKKLRRVERRFERMASETMEKEAKGAANQPEVEIKREAEFQRMLSQLSTEEVTECQKDFSQLWDEGGMSMTPSEEWDSGSQSKQPETPSNDTASNELDDDVSPQVVTDNELPKVTKVSVRNFEIPRIVVNDYDSDGSNCSQRSSADNCRSLSVISIDSDDNLLNYKSEDFDDVSLYTSDEDDVVERYPVTYVDFTNPKYDIPFAAKPPSNESVMSYSDDSEDEEMLSEDVDTIAKETLAERKSPILGPHLRWSPCSLETSPLGDASGDWDAKEAASSTTTMTTTTTTTKSRDGDGPTQGAAGGVSVTTTETRVVEVSGDQQELLEKLAAERHQ